MAKKKITISNENFIELYEKNSRQDLATLLSVSVITVYSHAKKLGLSKKGGRKKGVKLLNERAALARRAREVATAIIRQVRANHADAVLSAAQIRADLVFEANELRKIAVGLRNASSDELSKIKKIIEIEELLVIATMSQNDTVSRKEVGNA